MRDMARLALLVCPWLGGAQGAGDAQENGLLEDVRSAVEDYFGLDAERDAARALLHDLGEEALPSLRALANSRWVQRRDAGWKLVCAVSDVDTSEAGTLLAEMMAGETRVAPSQVLSALDSQTSRSVEHALDDPRTRRAVIAMIDGGDWFERSQALELATKQEWSEAVPKARALVRHEHLNVRKAAAAALEALAGEHVDIKRPSLRAPAVELLPSLIGSPRELAQPRGSGRTRALKASVDPWFDRGLGVVVDRVEGMLMLAPDGRSMADLPLQGYLRKWRFVDTDEGRWIVVNDVRDFAEGERVHARRADGSLVWTYCPPRRRSMDHEVLYQASGAGGIAVAIGGETGIVGLDLHGRIAWEFFPGMHVVEDLATHPGLPNQLLVVGWGASLQAIPPKAVERSLSSHFFSRGLLFPDGQGAPAIVLAGSRDEKGVEALLRVDAKGREAWRATLPNDSRAMTLIELDGERPLIAVLLADGLLLVLDENGTLVHESYLPGTHSEHGSRSLSAGATGEGELSLVALSDGRIWVHPVSAAALGER